MRIYGQKIFPVTITGEPYAFALAGNEAFGAMAIQECQDAITDITPGNRSLRAVRGALKKVVKSINEDYIDRRPDIERESARVDLLIGAWIPRSGGAHLFSSSGPALRSQFEYECLGTGSYLGRYLLRDGFHRNMSTDEVVLLATQMLLAVKTFDSSCGGMSQFLLIDKNGISTPTAQNISGIAEHFIAEYQALSSRLLLHMGNLDMDDSHFALNLDVFSQSVKDLRSAWKKVKTALQ
jgi:hypothetical protein